MFDLYYVLEIITVGNYNGLDAGPLTLLSPYILSLVNANGPTYVNIFKIFPWNYEMCRSQPGI